MTASKRDALLQAAARALSCVTAATGVIEVIVYGTDGTEIQVSGAPPAGELFTPTAPPAGGEAWLWLSPTEKAILGVADDRWQPAEQIAALAGIPFSGELKPILRNMVERNILESASGRGYRLAQPVQKAVHREVNGRAQ